MKTIETDQPTWIDGCRVDLERLKGYFPYRIVFATQNPETGKIETFADHTRRRLNKFLRNGQVVVIAK